MNVMTQGQIDYQNRPRTVITLRSIYGKRDKPNYTRRKNRIARSRGHESHDSMMLRMAARLRWGA